MRNFWQWVFLVLSMAGVARAEHDRGMELFMLDVSSNRQVPQRPPAPRVAPPKYDILDGQATRTHGFYRAGELWAQTDKGIERLFAVDDPAVVFPDGKVSRYSRVREYLQNYVSSYGPIRIQVHKIAGTSSFVQIRLFQPR